MEFYHTVCGGSIDTKSRSCLKCKKRWSWFSFKFTLTEIRPIPATLAKEKPKALRIKPGTTSYAKWGDKVPGVGAIASRLPNWPRWARHLTTAILIAVVAAIIVFLIK